MNNTIIEQGSYTSNGGTGVLSLRQGADWVSIYNYTQALSGTGSSQVISAQWFRGMPAGSAFVTLKTATTLASALTVITTGGFTFVDSSMNMPGVLNSTITAISNASIPVVTNTGTNGLSAGQIVRLINVAGAQQLGGIDFTVGYNTLSTTTFSLDYMAQIVAGTTGSWALIPYNPIFYPRRRTITQITQASQAVVTLSVTHGFTVGQAVRLAVPADFGMIQMNGLLGTIVAIDTDVTDGNTVTLNINSSAFNEFEWPLTSVHPFTPAEMIPVGEDSATSLIYNTNTLDDATINTALIGVSFGGGADFPNGVASDVIYWQAGASFSVQNM